MPIEVTDPASHRRDQIANLAELIRRSPARQSLIRAIYFGKKKHKSVPYLATSLKKSTKRITIIAKPLANYFFTQSKARENGKAVTIYAKFDFVQHNLPKILRLANNSQSFNSYHTKTNPQIYVSARIVKLAVPFKPSTQSICIDDIQEFYKVRSVKPNHTQRIVNRLPERVVKRGLIRLLGELSEPKDWGGELNDIFTTRITVQGRRKRAAFALKGPSKRGPLVHAMMGKNGDQIERLFQSPAQVFFVQYEDEIKQDILQLMSQLALAKATTEREVYYGIIDAIDTRRLRVAYPAAFKNERS